MGQKLWVRIVLKGRDPAILDNVANAIVGKAQLSGEPIVGPVALPRKEVRPPGGGPKIAIHGRLVELELEEEDLSRALQVVEGKDVEVSTEYVPHAGRPPKRKRKRKRRRKR